MLVLNSFNGVFCLGFLMNSDFILGLAMHSIMIK